MYEFVKIQFALGKISAEQLAKLVTRGWITQAQADTITAGEPAV
ncbi:MAG TPA: XkdX family protein [Candidatus Limiplasma sp.]|nr:XkdX family protein [Candidatus Limiplasma sp.]